MKKTIIGVLVLFLIVVAFLYQTNRQQAREEKIYHIGILVRGSFYEPAVVSYKRKLAELGYVEGKNIMYDVRLVNAKEELPAAISDFIKNAVDLIHTYSTPATQAAFTATKDLQKPIPIVFGSVGDPIAAGLVKDVQRPGTNVTGVVSLSTELTAKRLDLLKQINPKIKRVALPHTAEDAGDVAANKSVEIAKETAKKLGIELVFFPIHKNEENKSNAEKILKNNVDGMILPGDSLILGAVDLYAKQAIKERIPFAAFDVSNVQKGALVGFGPDYAISGEQAAGITHKILRGGKPEEIPVEVPKKLLLIVNTATAEKIGLALDSNFVRSADVVIKE